MHFFYIFRCERHCETILYGVRLMQSIINLIKWPSSISSQLFVLSKFIVEFWVESRVSIDDFVRVTLVGLCILHVNFDVKFVVCDIRCEYRSQRQQYIQRFVSFHKSSFNNINDILSNCIILAHFTLALCWLFIEFVRFTIYHAHACAFTHFNDYIITHHMNKQPKPRRISHNQQLLLVVFNMHANSEIKFRNGMHNMLNIPSCTQYTPAASLYNNAT